MLRISGYITNDKVTAFFVSWMTSAISLKL